MLITSRDRRVRSYVWVLDYQSGRVLGNGHPGSGTNIPEFLAIRDVILRETGRCIIF